MAAAATTTFFLILFLSILYLVFSFPLQDTAGSPQTATDFLNYATPVMQPPVDDQSITGLLPELPIAPALVAPVESGNESSMNVVAPTVGAPVKGGDVPSETVGAPVDGEKEPSDADAAPSAGAPVEGGNVPSVTVIAPTIGAAPINGGNEPAEGSGGSSINGGEEEQDPSDHGSPGLLTPSASPIPSTPAAAAAPVGGLNGPFGQQQQLEGSVINGEEQDLGAQPLVDNTPFDSGCTKVGYFISLLGYTGVATIASIGLLV